VEVLVGARDDTITIASVVAKVVEEWCAISTADDDATDDNDLGRLLVLLCNNNNKPHLSLWRGVSKKTLTGSAWSRPVMLHTMTVFFLHVEVITSDVGDDDVDASAEASNVPMFTVMNKEKFLISCMLCVCVWCEYICFCV
jgi:hypothetical protein